MLSAALAKLGRISAIRTVYVTPTGGVLPRDLWAADSVGALVEGYLSGPTDRAAAMDAAGSGVAHGVQCTVLAVEAAAGGGAASLAWLSQYPDLDEASFPPRSALKAHDSRVEGGVLVVRASCTTAADRGGLYEAERRAGALDAMRAGLKDEMDAEVAAQAEVRAAERFDELVKDLSAEAKAAEVRRELEEAAARQEAEADAAAEARHRAAEARVAEAALAQTALATEEAARAEAKKAEPDTEVEVQPQSQAAASPTTIEADAHAMAEGEAAAAAEQPGGEPVDSAAAVAEKARSFCG